MRPLILHLLLLSKGCSTYRRGGRKQSDVRTGALLCSLLCKEGSVRL